MWVAQFGTPRAGVHSPGSVWGPADGGILRRRKGTELIQGGRAALDQVRQSRVAAAECARALGFVDLVDDLELVTTELVTNAVLHGGGLRRFHLRTLDDGIRVEVTDRTSAGPVLIPAAEDAGTGRGLLLVAQLARRWGIERRADEKVIWAEVTGIAGDGKPELDDVIARDDPALVHVELGEVPTKLLVEAKAHVDTLIRELTLISVGGHSPGDNLSVLISTVANRFAGGRQSLKEQAARALASGEATTTLHLDLPLTAADEAAVYLAAMEELDGYCRAQRLTTLATPARHALFRRWYLFETIRQLEAASVGKKPDPPQPFQERMLEEVERIGEAQQVADRTARLYSVARALAAAGTPEAVATAVLHEGVAALGAAAGGLLLTTKADQLLLPGAVGYDEDVIARLRNESRNAELPAAVALRTGEPIWLESRSERDRRFPELIGFEPRTVAICAVPLIVQGRRLGALRFSFDETRLFDGGEREFVLALADHTAQALARAQLQAERIDVSQRLQRSLLPPQLPEIPGLQVAARYHPFGEGVEVGGDFYDLWEVTPGRWALAVGDATGTGPEAAALTALVRHSMRALTMSLTQPHDILRSLNTLLIANGLEFERFCTALFGFITLDEHGGVVVELANAGHPYPWRRGPMGQVDELQVDGSLLGVFDDPDYETRTFTLEPGSQLVLFTDGVLEARHGERFFASTGVADVLSAGHVGAETLAATLERAVLEHIGGIPTDDMAIIVLETEPLPAPREIEDALA
jgi:serine phosphatase RsbU (regulator of sigma subunit)/anti-sigma regulatory factor (Ser/Thr protein kinase)